MSKPTINGKKPLSSKRRPTGPAGIPDFFKNPMELPQDIMDDLESKGLECRWISYKDYVANGNSHGKGWSIYKAPKRSETDTFTLGNGPDGIIQRKEMVLSVRPKAMGDKHRAYLQHRADLQNKTFKKSKADEIRQMARDADLGAVVEGYEEQEGD